MHDVAIIGSGFGGSLLAIILRRLGRSVLLLEKGTHPRFVIGESSTPLADLLWLELATHYDLPQLVPFAKWGTWRAQRPDIACGLKRGFTFYHHRLGNPRSGPPGREESLLVAASPTDELADTHWYRPEFDAHLVSEAVRMGVEYEDRCEVRDVILGPAGARLSVMRRGAEAGTLEARFIVDATQANGPLPRCLGLPDLPVPHLGRTESLFTHFRRVRRVEDMGWPPGAGAGPYPADDAALHHVFDGGWIWVLRFVNGITSAGVMLRDGPAQRVGLGDGPGAWARLMEQLPAVAAAFEGAEPTRPFVHLPRVAFRTAPAAGPGWALLPSSAGFVDPLLSSGFALTLLGIERLARAVETAWGDGAPWDAAMQAHAAATAAEWEVLEHFVAALYARMGDFEAFTDVARLYFCAVVFCETARRLGRPEAAGGFLMRDHPVFGPTARACRAMALRGESSQALRGAIDPLVRQFDLGGLSDPARRPWYPVKADDLRAGRARVGATAAEIEALLRRAGWAAG